MLREHGDGFSVSVKNDAFALGLDGENCTCSSSLATPAVASSGHAISYVFASASQQLVINVTYELRPGAMFVSKSIALYDTAAVSGASRVRMVNAVSAMEGVELASHGQPASTTATKSNVQFFRWEAASGITSSANSNLNRTAGVFLTAQNHLSRVHR